MPRHSYRKEKPAQGTWIGNRLRISVGFEEKDFNQVAQLAKLNKVSFQEQVRRLCRNQILGLQGS